MDEQDYPIRHFVWMGEFAAELKSLPAQILDHDYSYESFGSWSAIVRHRGVPFRVLFDGKDGKLLVQRSTSPNAPYAWEAPSWQRVIRPGDDLAAREMADAVRSVASAG
jgi:hypothetical protein